MQKIPVNQLVDGLTRIPDADFVCDTVHSFLSENPVEFGSIQKYLHWSQDFYTRNLIYKDDRFEMMAVCWEKGQASRIHNHSEQRCWMTVPWGRLKGKILRSMRSTRLRAFANFERPIL
jgi:predicted metal-dependent enzyme (double-stranded beta helix superfamily)